MKSSLLVILLLFPFIFSFGQKAESPHLPLVNEYVAVDVEAKPINLYFVKDKIGYPAKAMKKKIEGNVYTRIMVNPQGEVQEYILTRVDHPYLGEAVAREIDLLKFTPAQRNDTAIHFWVNVPFKFYLRQTYNPRGQKHNYRTLVQRIFKSNLKKSQEFLAQGIELFHRRSFKEAGLSMKQCIHHTPKPKSHKSQEILIQANYYLGHAYTQLQSLNRALPYYTEAIGMLRTLENPSDQVKDIIPNLYIARGHALLKSNEPARALQDYNYVSKNFAEKITLPTDKRSGIPDPWRTDIDWINYQKGLVYLQLEKNQEAIKYFSLISDLTPSSPLLQVSLSHRGLAKSKIGDFEGAFNDIQTAIEINEEDPQAYYLKAMVLMEVESQEMASELLKQAKELFTKLDHKYAIPSIYPANE